MDDDDNDDDDDDGDDDGDNDDVDDEYVDDDDDNDLAVGSGAADAATELVEVEPSICTSSPLPPGAYLVCDLEVSSAGQLVVRLFDHVQDLTRTRGQQT